MAVKLNTKYLNGFISDSDYAAISDEVKAAQKTLHEKSGAGNDFLGWVDLPVNYDKEEFARIEKAAAKIRKDSQVLIVIGIGGSYLGAVLQIAELQSSLQRHTADFLQRQLHQLCGA